MWTAAILAGGRARRFGGRDKGALIVDGRTILERQIAMLGTVAGLREILIVGGPAAHPVARSIGDLVPGSGPMGGVHAALTQARGDAVFVLACDMPNVSAPLASYLIALSGTADLVVPRTEDLYHPLCSVYTDACLAPLARRLAERRLKLIDLIEDMRPRLVTAGEIDQFGDSRWLLRNVNSPVEYTALQNFHGYQL